MFNAYRRFYTSFHLPEVLVEPFTAITLLLIISVLALLSDLIIRRLLTAFLGQAAKRSKTKIDDHFVTHGVFTKAAHAAPAIVLYLLTPMWLARAPGFVAAVQTGALLYFLVVSVLVIYAILDVGETVYQGFKFSKDIPIRGFLQIIKIIIFAFAAVFGLAILLNKSPTILVSGMGAMTAVIMLIFKDPIIGLAAGVQLSANRMLAIGDWLEMPSHGADGDVIDISLTTVKVKNWDKTIVTVPTYALVSGSFKNWRGMSESGGRRMMRHVNLDLSSIHFLSPEEMQELREADLLTEYMEQKVREVEEHNRIHQVNTRCPANGRHLTNIGTFRAYLVAYLKKHPQIHNDMTFIVRQLEPTPQGLPMQVYVFIKDTRWAYYEGIQSDIFDHILAVIPLFRLKLYQQPSGHDLQTLGSLLTHETQ